MWSTVHAVKQFATRMEYLKSPRKMIAKLAHGESGESGPAVTRLVGKEFDKGCGRNFPLEILELCVMGNRGKLKFATHRAAKVMVTGHHGESGRNVPKAAAVVSAGVTELAPTRHLQVVDQSVEEPGKKLRVAML